MKEDTTTIDPTWMQKTGGYARDKTLRDEFAGLAMQGLVINGVAAFNEEIAHESYQMADAMLKAGKK